MDQMKNNANGVHCRVTRLNLKRKIRVNLKLLDKKLRSQPIVVLKPLSPKLIQKFDIRYYTKYKQKLLSKGYTEARDHHKNGHVFKQKTAVKRLPRMRLWCKSSDLIDYQNSLSLFETEPKQPEFDEPEVVSQVNSSDYLRYLNLIKHSELKRNSHDFLSTNFPLRRIDKCDNVLRNERNDIELKSNVIMNVIKCNQVCL
jgi:hypothetical protein